MLQSQDLAQCLKQLVFIERDLESIKIDLALKSDFNLGDCFKLFDGCNKGQISQHDLAHGLQVNLNFEQVNSVDIALFFKRHDKDNQGYLTFNQFSEAVLPFS